MFKEITEVWVVYKGISLYTLQTKGTVLLNKQKKKQKEKMGKNAEENNEINKQKKRWKGMELKW